MFVECFRCNYKGLGNENIACPSCGNWNTLIEQEMKAWPKNAVACVCCRVGDPYWNPVPDSTEIECWQCEHACMISPATKARLVENSKVLCVHCARAYYDASGVNMMILPDSKEQRAERPEPFSRRRLIDEGN